MAARARGPWAADGTHSLPMDRQATTHRAQPVHAPGAAGAPASRCTSRCSLTSLTSLLSTAQGKNHLARQRGVFLDVGRESGMFGPGARHHQGAPPRSVYCAFRSPRLIPLVEAPGFILFFQPWGCGNPALHTSLSEHEMVLLET